MSRPSYRQFQRDVSQMYWDTYRPPTPEEARAHMACKAYALLFGLGLCAALFTALNDADGALGSRISAAERERIDELLGNERPLHADEMQLTTRRSAPAASFSPEEAENASLLYLLGLAYAASFPPVILVCSIEDAGRRTRAWVRLSAMGAALLALWRYAGNERVLVPCLAALSLSPFGAVLVLSSSSLSRALSLGGFRAGLLLLLHEEPSVLAAACAACCRAALGAARATCVGGGAPGPSARAPAEAADEQQPAARRTGAAAAGAGAGAGLAPRSERRAIEDRQRAEAERKRAHEERQRKEWEGRLAREKADAEAAEARAAEDAAREAASRPRHPALAPQRAPMPAGGGGGGPAGGRGGGGESPQRLSTIYDKLSAAGLSSAEVHAAVEALRLPVHDSRMAHVSQAVSWTYERRDAEAKAKAEAKAEAQAEEPGPEARGPAAPAPAAPAPWASAGAVRSGVRSLAEQLTELSELHAQGALTPDEFTLAKRALLGAALPAAPPPPAAFQASMPMPAASPPAHGGPRDHDDDVEGLAACADSACCVLCLQRAKSHAFVPADERAVCMHKCVCETCAAGLKRFPREQWLCPICRTPARDIKLVYD